MNEPHFIERGPWTIDVDAAGGDVLINDARIEGTLRESITLTAAEARWLFRDAGPSVLIALRDAESEARREARGRR